MAKKKTPPDNGQATAVAEPPAPPPEPEPELKPNSPLVSWRYPAGRDTQIEVTIWENEVLGKDDETYRIPAVTTKRTFYHEGTWKTGGAFRVHELPVLTYALNRAYDWILAGRDLNNPLNRE
jgi:hypothetical protein